MADEEPPLTDFRVAVVRGPQDERLYVLWTPTDDGVWVIPSASASRADMELLADTIIAVGSFWDDRMPVEIARLIRNGLVRLVDLDDDAIAFVTEQVAQGLRPDDGA